MDDSTPRPLSPGRKTTLAIAVAAAFSCGGAFAVPTGETWTSGNYAVGTGVTLDGGTGTGLSASGSLGSLSNSGLVSGFRGIENVGVITELKNTAAGTVSGTNSGFATGTGILNSGTIGVLSNAGGTITSTGSAISNVNGQIGTLDNSGLISGPTFGVENFTGSISHLNNSGEISATFFAVYNSSGSQIGTLDNSGLISSSGASAIYNRNGSHIGTLNNTGVIRSDFSAGIGNIDSSIDRINNYGLISGPTAIRNDGTLGALYNAGTVAGDVTSSSAQDLIINGAGGYGVGVLTGASEGVSQADLGLITNRNSNVQFNAGNLLLNDAIFSEGYTVANNGARLQVNNVVFIQGNFTQAKNAALVFGVSDAAFAGPLAFNPDYKGYGQMLVNGTVTLASGSSVGLSKTGSAYSFAQGQRYLVLAAQQGSSSQFNEGTLNYTLNAPGLTLSGETVAYGGVTGASALVLTVVGGDGSTGAINNATARNSHASLEGLFQYQGTNEQLMDLSRAGAAVGSGGNRAGAQLSPTATTAAASSASVSATGKVFDVVGAHMDNLRTGTTSGIASGDSSHGKGLWGQAFGGNSRQDARDDVAGYRADYHGMLLGADAELNDSWRAGGLFSYTRTSVNNTGDNRHSSADINAYGLIGYATYLGNPWYLNLSAGAVQHQYDTKRQVSLTGFDGAAKGSYDGMQYVAAAQVGYPIDLGAKATLTPIAGLSYSTLQQDSYTEKGGNGAALRVKSDDIDSLKSDLGAKLERAFATEYGELIPAAQLTWRHEFRDEGVRSVANYVADVSGETTFGSNGPSALKDTGVLGLGLTLVRDNQLSLSAKYALETGSGYTANTGNVQVRWDF